MIRTVLGVCCALVLGACGDDAGSVSGDASSHDGTVRDGAVRDGAVQQDAAGVPNCEIDAGIAEPCLCNGVVETEGWCCITGHQTEVCASLAVFYVRSDATGANDGSDWTNAFTDLPVDLDRGAVYFVADGDYGAHDLDDPPSGASLIEIRKATETLHGTDVGWQSQYGDGQANFGPVNLSGEYYLLDGTAENGLRFVGDYEGLVADIGGAHITLRRCELDGNFTLSGGQHVDGACNVANIGGSDITLDRCDLHNAADDGIGVYGQDIQVLNSRIHRLHGCGTDGGCGPCFNGHSDGLELQNTTNVTLVGNMVYDIQSTAALITGQWTPGNYTRNLTMINNIFYTPATGITVYLYYVQTAHIYNNIIWGRSQGNRYGGLAIGPEATDIHMHNNIILNINYSHLGGVFDPANHHFDFNLFGDVNTGEYTLNNNEFVADPLFAVIPISGDMNDHIEDGLVVTDFALTAASPAIDTGMDLSGAVDQDIEGRTRPVDGDNDGNAAYDIGAYEYAP